MHIRLFDDLLYEENHFLFCVFLRRRPFESFLCIEDYYKIKSFEGTSVRSRPFNRLFIAGILKNILQAWHGIGMQIICDIL